MSQRVKKPGRPPADDSQGKRRRRRPSGSDADEDGTRSGSNSGGNGSLTGMWTPRHLNDLKVSSIYNRNSAEAPAELYRKDLISAMKLPDGEPLTPEEYWLITDSWKQEWEKGVQVPVNPESLPEPEVKLIQPVAERSHDFRLPKKKYVRVTHDDFFNPDFHQLVSTAARAEKVCSYDLDDVDAAWLGCSNADRAMQNTTLISEFLMEQVIEELELQCWEQVQTILKSQEGLGIEYDENVICDVCRSPESEEGNEMVFCDSCNICVHQACYGITTIPSGSWLCRTCTLGIKPACVLCPNVGGAMKATRSGHTWAHVACAIWIPEVSIGSVEKMEPITKISSIPQSRWSLVCVLCKEKTGACIQCSVKTCKTAYHVTCAFKNGLEMKPIIVDENAEDGIKLRSYCQKHSVNTKKEKAQSGSEAEDAEKKKMKAMTAEERNQARAEKLQQIEAEFFKYVRLKDVSQRLAVDMDVVILIYNYWKLKRKSLNNRPLVPPRPETTQLLTQQQEQDLEQMKMFVQLRQDLERVRNLCYMVSRREKLSRSFFRLREQTFQKQLAILSEPNDLTPEERQAVLAANHGPSIYDQLYSHNATASTSTSTTAKGALPDYESLISMIAGGLEAKKETLMNGIIKAAGGNAAASGSGKRQTKAAASAVAEASSSGNSASQTSTSAAASGKEPTAGPSSAAIASSSGAGASKDGSGNPYKKQFVNGARRRNMLGESSHSESESESKPQGGVTATAKTTKIATPSPPVKGKKGKAAIAAAAAAAAVAAAAAAAAATAATTTPPDSKAKATGKGTKGARKPLSYLFDSDSSVENATPPVTQPSSRKGQKGAAAAAKGGKAKGKTTANSAAAPPAKASATSVTKNIIKGGLKSSSYLSDSDELELPTAATRGGTAGTNKDGGKPIYSDSEEDVKSGAPPPPTVTKKEAAKGPAKKEKATGKKGKADSQEEKPSPPPKTPSPKKGKKGAAAAAVPVAVTTPPKPVVAKGKAKAGGKKGRKAAGFDPTELIVPQREAAKKATESIRSVKQKTKDQQQSAKEDEAAGLTVKDETPLKESPEKAKKSAVVAKVSTLSDSEVDEKPVVTTPAASGTSRAAGRKGKSPERRVTATAAATAGGKGKKAPAVVTLEEVEDDEEDGTGDGVKDEFEFEEGREGSSKNVSYVPQRQAAKKAAEHIRSGLSNIVAARLIIEDEMEATRKKQKTTDKVGGAKGPPGGGSEETEVESRLGGIAGAAAAAMENKDKIQNAVAEAAKKVTGKERPVPANKGLGKVVKGGRKEEGVTATTAVTGGKDAARGGRDSSDWPFLDKGSQSVCRRSRERSSSSGSSSGSSGSSSSGSSCSSSRSSSASSSRSSSADSASPEPRSPVVPATATKGKASNQQIIASAVSKLSAAASQQETGPGRKLKTSERVPPPTVTAAAAKSRNTPVRAETTAREKPAPKGGRSAKPGSRGGVDPFRSAFSPSPEPEPKPTGTYTAAGTLTTSSTAPASRGNTSTAANNTKVSPLSQTLANEKQQQQRGGPGGKGRRGASPVSAPKAGVAQSPEKKGGRRKGESSSPARPGSRIGQQQQTKAKDSNAETAATAATSTARNRSASPAKTVEKRSPTKTLAGRGGRQPSPAKQQPQQHIGPQLSSESETESTPPPPPPPSTRNRKNSSQPAAAESPSQQRKRRSDPSSVSGGTTNLGLSDSDEESGTEEKENAQRLDGAEHHHPNHHASSPVVSAKSKGSSQRGGSTPALPSATSILSPITPTTENKDKDVERRLSDTEQPETKRPRLDSSSSTAAAAGGAASTSAGGGHLKSIFSPSGSTGGEREHDIGLDFDTELYDLAKSVVTEEYTHRVDHDDEDSCSESLHFNFSHSLFSEEDNKEDSARATLNLVEKLRMQHAQKSSGHRPSTDSMSDAGQCDNLLEETKSSPSSSRPGSSLQQHIHPQDEPTVEAKGVSSPTPTREQLEDSTSSSSKTPFSAISALKSPSSDGLLHGSGAQSPDRTKQSIQGDERWVPPSKSGMAASNSSNSTPQHRSSSSIPSSGVPPPHPSPRSLNTNNTGNVLPPEPSPPIQQQHEDEQGGNSSNCASDKHLSSPSSFYHHHHHHHHLGHSARSDKGSTLSLETLPSPPTPLVPSPMVSPLLSQQQHIGRPPQSSASSSSSVSSASLAPPPPPPPYSQNAASAAALAAAAMMAAETSPNNIAAAAAAAAAAGLPFGANTFMYSGLANNPAFASVVSSLAAAVGPNALASLLQGPPTKQGPGSPVGYPPFIPTSVMQQSGHHPALSTSAVSTPTPSPGASSTASSTTSQQQASVTSQPPRRPSDVSPLVTVAASMPPLAKPPLTSPSILFATNNCSKSMSAPPLQSAVAHIIESVVNNHQASTSLPKTTLSLDMHLPLHSSAMAAASSTNLSTVKTPLTSPVVANTVTSTVDVGAFLGKKTIDNLLTPTSKHSMDYSTMAGSVATAAPSQASPQLPPPPPPVTSTAGGAGRGRRASTPRAAKQAPSLPEKLSGVNAVIEDMMMSPVPKGKGGRKGASPGRGKGPPTPVKRGGASAAPASSAGTGRGKGKSKKDLIGMRKDLAGTVYDIDFDEFEENTPEKIDLRSLRERRKSNETVHHAPSTDTVGGKHQSKHQSLELLSPPAAANNSSPLVLTLPVPHAYRQTKEEKRAAKQREKEQREKERELAKKQKQLEKQLLKQGQKHQQQQQQPLVAPLKISLTDSFRQQQQQQMEHEKKKEEEATAKSEAPSTEKTVSTSSTTKSSAAAAALLQAPLPGPVDMRTYSASGTAVTGRAGTTPVAASGTGSGATAGDNSSLLGEKIGFPAAAKDPSSEIASLFGMTSSMANTGSVEGGTGSSTVVNDLEELDKALEDLVTKPSKTQQQQQASSERMTGSSRDTGKVGMSPSSSKTTGSCAVSDVISSVSSMVVKGSVILEQQRNQNTQQHNREEPPAASRGSPVVTPSITSQSISSILSGSGSEGSFPPVQQSSSDSISNGAAPSGSQQVGGIPLASNTNTSSSAPSTESDLSRNQLKVKIKGPFLDANYSSAGAAASSMTPSGSGMYSHHPHSHGYQHPHHLQSNAMGPPGGSSMYAPAPHFPPHHQHWMMNSANSASASNSMDNNPSNLRRMRKKELLRKYWNEDMNMDGGTSSSNPPGYPLGPSGSGGIPGHHHHFHHDGVGGLMGHHGPPSHHPHHPLGRSVITIPKAVASMSILPSTQDDHDPTGNDASNDGSDPLGFGGLGDPLSWKDGLGGSKDGKSQGTQKKRRSRGIYREMAALGILPPDAVPPRNERRRDRQVGSSTGSGGGSGQGGQSPNGSTTGSDTNSRKRVRGSNKQASASRSTFIPPTLADDSPAGAGESGKGTYTATSSTTGSSGKGSGGSATATSMVGGTGAVVNVVNHPTPKLKIKFGELSSSGGIQGAGSSGSGFSGSSLAGVGSLLNNTNHLSDSDKETPNKKAKGRPPKKRGLPDTASTSSSSSNTSASTVAQQMELLKRESMKYREMVMKDYAMAEQQEILKLSGTRRSKKHKRKAGASAGGSETDDASSVRSKSPAEIKIIDGPKPKLILRFGRNKGKKGKGDGGSGTASDNSCSSGRNSAAADKISQNGLPAGQQNDNSQGGLDGENDSGFTTASGEGSSGSSSNNDTTATSTGQSAVKEKTLTTPIVSSTNNNNNNINTSEKSGAAGGSTTTNSNKTGNIRNGGSSSAGPATDKVLVVELAKVTVGSLPPQPPPLDNNKLSVGKGANKNSTSTGSVGDVPGATSSKGPSAGGGGEGEKSAAKTDKSKPYVPIRLKLSRCYEGSYSLKNKEGAKKSGDGMEGDNGGTGSTSAGAGAPPAAKQTSDSCQVR